MEKSDIWTLDLVEGRRIANHPPAPAPALSSISAKKAVAPLDAFSFKPNQISFVQKALT